MAFYINIIPGIAVSVGTWLLIDFDKPDRVESTCLQHVAVLDRIAARDIPGARAALRTNVEEGRSIVRSTVKEALARAYSIH